MERGAYATAGVEVDASARVEPPNTGLRAYFMPDDEKSTLYIYEADVT